MDAVEAAVSSDDEIRPDLVSAKTGSGIALRRLGRFDEAASLMDRPLLSFNLGRALLATGNFREGWERYSYRVVMGGNKWLRPEAPAVPWMG